MFPFFCCCFFFCLHLPIVLLSHLHPVINKLTTYLCNWFVCFSSNKHKTKCDKIRLISTRPSAHFKKHPHKITPGPCYIFIMATVCWLLFLTNQLICNQKMAPELMSKWIFFLPLKQTSLCSKHDSQQIAADSLSCIHSINRTVTNRHATVHNKPWQLTWNANRIENAWKSIT